MGERKLVVKLKSGTGLKKTDLIGSSDRFVFLFFLLICFFLKSYQSLRCDYVPESGAEK
jgi:hypothetical protein